MTRQSVFISYAREDADFKDALLGYLTALDPTGRDVTAWTDDDIPVGQNFRVAITSALNAADVAILLVSVDSLVSSFVQTYEVPAILERRKADGMLFVPVLVRHCPFRRVPWLERLNLENPTPLADLTNSQRDRRLTEIAERIEEHLVAIRAQVARSVADPVSSTTEPRAGPAEANPLHVDRDEELEVFRSIFDAGARRNVLVVGGDRGIGKTWFLHKCLTATPPGTRICWVDFKEVGKSVNEVISLFIQRLDYGARFPRTLDQLRLDATVPGGTSTVAEDLLTKLFVDEARLSRQPSMPDLIVMDGFEWADEFVRVWISRGLIGSVVSDPQLTLKLVVAGRGVEHLEQSHPTGVTYRGLRPLRLEDAATLAVVIGIDLPMDRIKELHTFAAGNPFILATGFDNLKREHQAGVGSEAPAR